MECHALTGIVALEVVVPDFLAGHRLECFGVSLCQLYDIARRVEERELYDDSEVNGKSEESGIHGHEKEECHSEILEHPVLVNPPQDGIRPFEFQGKKSDDESGDKPKVRPRNPEHEEVDRQDQSIHHKDESLPLFLLHRHAEIEPRPSSSSSRFLINEGKNRKGRNEYQKYNQACHGSGVYLHEIGNQSGERHHAPGLPYFLMKTEVILQGFEHDLQ